MSRAALNWAFSRECLPSPQKFTLVALADHASEDQGLVWISVETIRGKTSLNEKTIRRALADLVKGGLIIDTGRRMGDTRQCKVYQFPSECQRLPNTGTFEGERRVEDTHKDSPKVPRKVPRKTPSRLPNMGSESGNGNQEPVIKEGGKPLSSVEVISKEKELTEVRTRIKSIKRCTTDGFDEDQCQKLDRLHDLEIEILQALGRSLELATPRRHGKRKDGSSFYEPPESDPEEAARAFEEFQNQDWRQSL